MYQRINCLLLLTWLAVPAGSIAGHLTDPPEAQIAFTSEATGGGDIYLMNADGSNLTRLTDDPSYDLGPAWSPDGTRIAFISMRSGNPDIYVMDADGANVTQLTNHSAMDFWPDWSPDGSRILFASWRDTNGEIYVMNADGSNLRRLTSTPNSSEDFPAWSTDGSRIVYSLLGEGEGTYVMDSSGGDVQKIFDFPAMETDWSPDGQRIAFGSDHEGFRAVYVANPDGSDLQKLSTTTAGENCPDWSQDGTQITFASWRDGDGEIYIMDADGSNLQKITNNSSHDEFPSWRPSPLFTRVAEGPHVSDGAFSFGASWIDYDNDSYPDLMVSNSRFFGSPSQYNVLYRNNGDGTYARVIDATIDADTNSMASAWGDFDNDGDLDVYLPCLEQLNHFYANSDGVSFEDYAPGTLGGIEEWTGDAVWVDYDNDGWLDLFLANHRPPGDPPGPTGALYRNEVGTFTLMPNDSIGLIEDESSSAAWGDYDGDGDSDLFWTRNEKSALLYENNGDGTFSQVLTGDAVVDTTHGGNWADFDNDGDLDLCANSGWGRPLTLYENADGILQRVPAQPLTTDTGYWEGGYWGDYDNDGFIDLFIAGNYMYGGHLNRLYHNDGDGTFSRITSGIVATDNEPSACAVWADHDHDGDLDLYVVNASNANNTLYSNNGNGNNWINIRLVGVLSNHDGIGAKVRVKAVIDGNPIWQLREISSRAGLRAQSGPDVHFGLGDATIIETVKVEWPSGLADTLLGVDVNQFLVITEGLTHDLDGDGIPGIDDNCPNDYNPGQEDRNDDGVGDACCCVGRTGNTDGDVEDVCDIGDLTTLIDYLFISFEEPDCMAEADVDGISTVDIGDLTGLIDYLFISFEQPADCPLTIGPVLEIPFGTPVVMDGAIGPGEWSDAVRKEFTVEGYADVTVMIKHDGTSLLAACHYVFQQEENLCFPEILLDVGNDKTENWMSDDWWFHVSGTDCEAHGTYDVWNDCSVVQPDWDGVPNFAMVPDPPPLDTFEIRIPLTKIGIVVGDTIGLAFRAEWVPLVYGYWPAGAVVESPSTWGTVILKP